MFLQYTSPSMLVSKPIRDNTQNKTLTLYADGEDRFDLVFNPCNANFARFVMSLHVLPCHF